MMVACLCVFAEGVKFTILMMNTKTVIIGKKQLKVGDSFTEGDIGQIKWISGQQFLKARNETTKRTQVLSLKSLGKKESPSLNEYLVKKRKLSTRSFGQKGSDVITYTINNDTIIQLPDTVALDISTGTNDQTLYAAEWEDGKNSLQKSIPISDDGQQLYITRDLFGSRTPQEPYVIKILKYDLTTDSEPDSLGWLYIEPLPLIIE